MGVGGRDGGKEGHTDARVEQEAVDPVYTLHIPQAGQVHRALLQQYGRHGGVLALVRYERRPCV